MKAQIYDCIIYPTKIHIKLLTNPWFNFMVIYKQFEDDRSVILGKNLFKVTIVWTHHGNHNHVYHNILKLWWLVHPI